MKSRNHTINLIGKVPERKSRFSRFKDVLVRIPIAVKWGTAGVLLIGAVACGSNNVQDIDNSDAGCSPPCPPCYAQDGGSSSDGGSPQQDDGGAHPFDGGPMQDGGQPVDGGVQPFEDGGPIPQDGGAHPFDGGVYLSDGGAPVEDGGQPVDGGVQPFEDGGPIPQDGGTPAQDGGVQPPPVEGELSTLVGDDINKNLLDRGKLPSDYPLNGELSDNSNPFSDGTYGGYLADSPGATKLYRVSAENFSLLETFTIEDNDASTTYTQIQNIWMNGRVVYLDSENNLVADTNLVAYSLKFSDANNIGIPVCTQATGSTDYSTCDDSYRTDTHKVKIMFLGEKWVITEMSPPTTSTASEYRLTSGGHIKLAKETVQDVLQKGEFLRSGDLKFVATDIFSDVGGIHVVVSVYVVNGPEEILVKEIQLDQRTTQDVAVPGYGTYKVHLYKASIGYVPGAEWADLAIFSDELKLQSGYDVDSDSGINDFWKVSLGWKDRGADGTTDHLRTVIVYSNEIDSLLHGEKWTPGRSIPIIQDPANWDLQFGGLDITDVDRDTLKFLLERNANRTFSIVDVLGGPEGVSCTISAPYVKGSSEINLLYKLFILMNNGQIAASHYDFYVATNGGSCSGGSVIIPQGTLFMKSGTSSPSPYIALPYTQPIGVNYPTASDGELSTWETGGMIYIANANDAMTMYPFSQYTIPVSPDADFLFGISERAGLGVSWDTYTAMLFGLRMDGANSTLNFDGTVSGTQYFYGDHIYTIHAGPAYSSNGTEEEGTINERGSKFVSKDETSVWFRIADKLGLAKFFFKKNPSSP